MAKTLIAVFRGFNEAEAVLNDFVQAGFPREDVSLIAGDRQGLTKTDVESRKAATKAGTGAAVGGVAGAGVGAAAGGIIGALVEAGVPRRTAGTYADAVQAGGTLVAIRVEADQIGSAEAIVNRHGPVELDKSESGPEPEQAWHPGDPHADAPTFGDEGSPSEWGESRLKEQDTNLGTGRAGSHIYDPEQSAVPDISDRELRAQYESAWYPKYSWEDFSEAYRFGYSLGVSSRYGTSDWVDVEGEARRYWELNRPDSWHKFNEGVRFGWDHAKGRR